MELMSSLGFVLLQGAEPPPPPRYLGIVFPGLLWEENFLQKISVGGLQRNPPCTEEVLVTQFCGFQATVLFKKNNNNNNKSSCRALCGRGLLADSGSAEIFQSGCECCGEKGHFEVPVTVCVSFVELWACRSQIQALPGPYFTSRGPNPGQQVTQFGNVKHRHLMLE